MASRNGRGETAVLEQLSFDVGKFDAPVEASTFKPPAISSSKNELKTDDRATVVVMDEHGTVLVEAECIVAGVQLRKHRATSSRSAWVERVQQLAVIE